MELNEIEQKVLEKIDTKEIVNLLSEAVKRQSICEDEGAERETADFFADFWKEIHLDTKIVEVERNRPNIHGTLKGAGEGPTLMFGGHLDTEPIPSPEKWTHDPLSGDVDWEGGWIYGLGTANMKQGIAAFSGAVHAIIKAGIKLKGKLILTGWMNEVGGDIGSRYMADHGPLPDICVIGEPTNCEILTTHTGAIDFTITTKGIPTHIGDRFTKKPGFEGINAFDKMMKVIKELKDIRKTFTYHRHPTIGDPVINVGNVKTEIVGKGLRPALSPYACKADLDMRYVPGMSVESIIKDIKKVFLDIWVEDRDFEAELYVWPRSYNLHPAETSREEPIVKTVAKAHREVFGEEVTFADEDPPYRYYWTDACVLSGILKIPTINYGAAGGETVVRPDERVNINQLINAAKVYALTALETCGVL